VAEPLRCAPACPVGQPTKKIYLPRLKLYKDLPSRFRKQKPRVGLLKLF